MRPAVIALAAASLVACALDSEPELDEVSSAAVTVFVQRATPSYGEWGETITMTGFGFTTLGQGWCADFNGLCSPIQVVSDTTLTTTVPSGATDGRVVLKLELVSIVTTIATPISRFFVIDRSLQKPTNAAVTQVSDNALQLTFTDTLNTTHDGYDVQIYDGANPAGGVRHERLGPAERSLMVTSLVRLEPFLVGHDYIFEVRPTGPRGRILDGVYPWTRMTTTARASRAGMATAIFSQLGYDDGTRDGVVFSASVSGQSRGHRFPMDNNRVSILPEQWEVLGGALFHAEAGLRTNTIAMATTDGGRFIAFHFDRFAANCPGILMEGNKDSVFVDPRPIVDACDLAGAGVTARVRGFGTDPFIKTETLSFEFAVTLERQ